MSTFSLILPDQHPTSTLPAAATDMMSTTPSDLKGLRRRLDEIDDNLLSLVTAKADEGTLTIGSKGNYSTSSGGLKVTITAPNVDGLSIDGSGSATLTGVHSSNLDLDVSGSVALNSAHLNVSLGYQPTVGTALTILNNDGIDAVSGTFTGLPEGQIFRWQPAHFRPTFKSRTKAAMEMTLY